MYLQIVDSVAKYESSTEHKKIVTSKFIFDTTRASLQILHVIYI